MRLGDRGHFRAHGLEKGSVREGGSAHRAAGDFRQQHLRIVDQCLGGDVSADAATAVLRHPLFQPAALHALGRADRTAGDRSRFARPAGVISGQRARQGSRARQGHAKLRRQPGGNIFHAGDDGAHEGVRPWLRCRRRANRARDRPREKRDISHGRRRRSRHHGARHRDHGPDAARRSMAQVLPGAGVAQGADRQGCTRAEEQGRRLSEGRQGNTSAGFGDLVIPFFLG